MPTAANNQAHAYVIADIQQDWISAAMFSPYGVEYQTLTQAAQKKMEAFEMCLSDEHFKQHLYTE